MVVAHLGTQQGELSRKDRRRSLRAAAIGNSLEWYDWTIYGTLSAYLASSFFSKSDPTSALLSTLGIFAGGFLVRPLGGLLFGRLGDRWGRKTTLVLTMTMLALTSLGIAVAPTYDDIGTGASIILFALRVLQGLAHGGESGVSYTYVAEIAPPERRGLWSSSVYISVMLGVMAATALAAVLTSTLGAGDMTDWGWRVGFGVGSLLGIYALFLRRSAAETETFTNLQQANEQDQRDDQDKTAPGQRLAKRDIVRIALLTVGLSAVMNVIYYTWVTFAPATAIAERGMNAGDAFGVSLLAQAAVLVLLPLMGAISDRLGRRPNMIAFGLLVVIAVFPLRAMLTDEPWTLFVSQGLGLAVWSIGVSIYPALMAELIPARIRAVGIGVTTSLSAALFGGTAPYLNAWLSSTGAGWVFNTYMIVLAAGTLAAAVVMPETKASDLTGTHNRVPEDGTDMPMRSTAAAGRED